MREVVIVSSSQREFCPSPLVGEGGASRSEATGEGYLTARQALQGYPPAPPRAVATHRCSSSERPEILPPKGPLRGWCRFAIRRVDSRRSQSPVASRSRRNRGCSS